MNNLYIVENDVALSRDEACLPKMRKDSDHVTECYCYYCTISQFEENNSIIAWCEENNSIIGVKLQLTPPRAKTTRFNCCAFLFPHNTRLYMTALHPVKLFAIR